MTEPQTVPDGMVAIVNNKRNMFCVRADIADQYLPCMRCMGDGSQNVCVGQIGHLGINGWQVRAFETVYCPSCGGMGACRIPGLGAK